MYNALREHQSEALSMIQERLVKYPRSYVLDLGQASNQILQYLSPFGCKLDIVDFYHDCQQNLSHLPQHHHYDILFCWDLLNYVPHNHLNQLVTYLVEHANPHALLHFFTRNQSTMPPKPCQFIIQAPNRLYVTPQQEEEIICPRYSNRKISTLLLNCQQKHALLLTNGLQENLWMKSSFSKFSWDEIGIKDLKLS